MTIPDFDGLETGQIIAERVIEIDRNTLVRYAGASGDFNPIHYREDIATSVGLPGVIAHGMLTMGAAIQPVSDWIGDPARIQDYQVRFTRPILVEPQGAAEVTIQAKVGQLLAEERIARIDLTVTFGGQTVLGKAQARVSFA